MCSPALIPVAIGAGSGLLSGLSNKAQAESQADALRQNAVYLGRAAADARARGRSESDWKRVEGQRMIGTQRAAMAASGGQVGTGSNAIMEQDTAQLAEFDALTIMNNAAREAYGYDVQRVDALNTARNLEKQGKSGVLRSLLGGALQGGMMAAASGAFAPASGAGAVNLQGQAAPLTNNPAFVRMM